MLRKSYLDESALLMKVPSLAPGPWQGTETLSPEDHALLENINGQLSLADAGTCAGLDRRASVGSILRLHAMGIVELRAGGPFFDRAALLASIPSFDPHSANRQAVIDEPDRLLLAVVDGQMDLETICRFVPLPQDRALSSVLRMSRDEVLRIGPREVASGHGPKPGSTARSATTPLHNRLPTPLDTKFPPSPTPTKPPFDPEATPDLEARTPGAPSLQTASLNDLRSGTRLDDKAAGLLQQLDQLTDEELEKQARSQEDVTSGGSGVRAADRGASSRGPRPQDRAAPFFQFTPAAEPQGTEPPPGKPTGKKKPKSFSLEIKFDSAEAVKIAVLLLVLVGGFYLVSATWGSAPGVTRSHLRPVPVADLTPYLPIVETYPASDRFQARVSPQWDSIEKGSRRERFLKMLIPITRAGYATVYLYDLHGELIAAWEKGELTIREKDDPSGH